MTPPLEKKPGVDGSWLAIGIGVGVAIGVATDNLALWLSLGVVIGCAGPWARSRRKTSGKRADSSKDNCNE